MSAAELAGWYAYNKIEPLGRWREDMMLAQIASLIFNVNRGKTTQAKSPQDFMFVYRDQKEANEVISWAKSLQSQFSED